MTIKDKLDIKDELLKVQDPILQVINKKFVSISPDDKKIYVDHFKKVLSKLIEHMKDADELFRCLYQRECYAGSYPDKLKVGKPEEFDMNLVMKLPSVNHNEMMLEETDEPGFVKVNMNEALKKVERYNHWNKDLSKKIKKWIDADGYLLQNKFREWMEGVLDKTFDRFISKSWNGTRDLVIQGKTYMVRSNKQGPALKLTVMTPDNLVFEVDLVPAFAFAHPSWPPQTRSYGRPAKKGTWYIIPKPKDPYLSIYNSRKWRTSFQEQEGELINGTGTLKPVIRLLKKLRDRAGIGSKDLSSYAIKTVVMWEMEKQRDTEFWASRLSYLFIHMLGCVIEHIRRRSIPNFWDPRNNLLDVNRNHSSVLGQLERIYKDILCKMAQDKFIIAKKLLTDREFSELFASPERECSVETVDTGKSSLGSFLTGCAEVFAAGALIYMAIRRNQNND